MGRAPCCDKANVKKGPWSPEEDAKLKAFIEQHGTGGNWIALPQKIGLKRCGKSCRLRWLNYLRPNIKHGGFSEEEDNIICSLYISIGSRWSIIAAQLPGRTDNDIKNYWNTRLKKKLLGKQRKEQQQQQQARRVKNEAGNPLLAETSHPLPPYWPQPPVPLPSPCLVQEHPHLHSDQASIKKLLVKLGGRFSDSNGLSPTGFQTHVYEEPVNLVTGSGGYNVGPPLLPAPSIFTNELDEMVFNPRKKTEGFDCFYGLGEVGNDQSSTVTTSGESMSWGEMSSFIYPPLISNYEQGLSLQEGVTDSRYLVSQ